MTFEYVLNLFWRYTERGQVSCIACPLTTTKDGRISSIPLKIIWLISLYPPIPIKTKRRLTCAFVEGAQILPIESSFETAKVFASIFAISVSCGSSKNLAPLVVAWARASYSLPKSRFSRLNVGKEMTQVILICLQPRKSFQRSFVWKDFFTTLQNWTA